MVATPPKSDHEAAFHRGNAIAVAVAAFLAGAGLVGSGLSLGGVALLLNAAHHDRSFSYRPLAGLSTIAMLAFLGGGAIQHWPDIKQGFVDGYTAARGPF